MSIKKLNSKKKWQTYTLKDRSDTEKMKSKVYVTCMRVISDDVKFDTIKKTEGNENVSCSPGRLEIHYEKNDTLSSLVKEKPNHLVFNIPIMIKTIPDHQRGNSGDNFDTLFECIRPGKNWNIHHPKQCQGSKTNKVNYINPEERNLNFLRDTIGTRKALPLGGLGL